MNMSAFVSSVVLILLSVFLAVVPTHADAQADSYDGVGPVVREVSLRHVGMSMIR